MSNLPRKETVVIRCLVAFTPRSRSEPRYSGIVCKPEGDGVKGRHKGEARNRKRKERLPVRDTVRDPVYPLRRPGPEVRERRVHVGREGNGRPVTPL